ncbi:MAG TPA: hypothetical protein VK785_05825 [Opitutaceae bacterium]|nr:hypothetical protein [Opitutaceae bacterium]
MKTIPSRVFTALLCLGLCSVNLPVRAAPQTSCPSFGWEEGLGQFLKPDAPFPINDTASVDAPDCAFHQWSWEAFIWATALLKDPVSGTVVPRFMMLPTPDDLLSPVGEAGKLHLRPLKLAARSRLLLGAPGFTEGAGAIVEADGNMLVGQNGYPIYASVHMDPSYFNTAQQNLIINGGYNNQPAGAFFSPGAAVFKATWLRLAPGQLPPAGTFTTQAQVPVLETQINQGTVTIAPVPGKFATVTVALVGLHVVGYTLNHPEFLWGTFEHNLNSPATPDNTFSTTGSSPGNFTFYTANTSFAQVNQAVIPPQLKLNAATQQLRPVTNVVLENQTGGENQPDGPQNVLAVTAAAQRFLSGLQSAQSTFATYNLNGTVWMAPNTYNLNSNQTNAVGSVNLANATAETFVQTATNTPIAGVTNCFLCHNPTSYSFQAPPPPKLTNRLIALSHVLAVGSAYAVPNQISSQASAAPADSLRVPQLRAAPTAP